ncbi:hypothetical protein B0J18DRAFT_429397 [Chaetomium sp. MPI-SDFR-AT-0129]|nr:hypothetical protein B0J18DRAFT_429397 [Chaetomium sp. MPI-SDFR-AT-0129]
MSLPPPFTVTVHNYHPSPPNNNLVQTYEYIFPSTNPTNPNPPVTPTPQNALVFIGGLGDGPHTIPYIRHIAKHLSATASGWTVFEARLSSVFTGFGYGSLERDAGELRDLVKYLRRGRGDGEKGFGKVVLMGHSTGCQDCLEYAKGVVETAGEGERGEVRVDGYILQGPVSDREAIGMTEDAGEVESAVVRAVEMVREGKGEEVMEKGLLPGGWRNNPITAYRWASLAGVGGDDDYFSSDLSDEKLAAIWGKVEQPVLIVPSEKDEWVSREIDVMGQVTKWKGFCKPGIASDLSGLIPGANHRVDNTEGQEWLSDRVARFLADLEKRE